MQNCCSEQTLKYRAIQMLPGIASQTDSKAAAADLRVCASWVADRSGIERGGRLGTVGYCRLIRVRWLLASSQSGPAVWPEGGRTAVIPLTAVLELLPFGTNL